MSAVLNAKCSFVGIIGTLIGRFPTKMVASTPVPGESLTYGVTHEGASFPGFRPEILIY